MVAIDPTAKLSMWWDLEAGRETEIDFINGATVRYGKQLNVTTPAMMPSSVSLKHYRWNVQWSTKTNDKRLRSHQFLISQHESTQKYEIGLYQKRFKIVKCRNYD